MSSQPSKQTVATRDGFKLGFVEQGDGVPCVLLHGLSASAQLNWLEPGVADRLARSNLRAIALDFRGHGDSERPPESSAYSFERLTDDCVDLIKGLDLGPCHLVGYSLGALV
ncbi:MAG: alpha/beta hydrolase, partial [Actinobacteria bacterium]|nr:alpha/beta hydrolase [Actinomycetota bacterium]